MSQEQVIRMTYHDYLQTERWKEFRKTVLEHYGKKCCRCGREAWLNIHHLTYERLGCEKLSDVIVLCKECHMAEHAKQVRICSHHNVIPTNFVAGTKIEYAWHCLDCGRHVLDRQPTEKELEEEPAIVEILIKREEERMERLCEEAKKRKEKEVRRKQREKESEARRAAKRREKRKERKLLKQKATF